MKVCNDFDAYLKPDYLDAGCNGCGKLISEHNTTYCECLHNIAYMLVTTRNGLTKVIVRYGWN
jgi:hypothetical protein